MSERKYRELRQRLGYKPAYKNRKYKLFDRIINFFRRGKWVNLRRFQRINVLKRAAYRQAKKLMKEKIS